MTPEERAIFIADYIPLLSPNAITIYFIADSLRNKNNITVLNYAELTAHIGTTNPTIRKAIASLRELGLIRSPRHQGDGPAVTSLGRHEMLPIVVLSNKKRDELFKVHGRVSNTKIRDRVLEVLPPTYKSLLSRSKMIKALVKIGAEEFKLQNIAEHFKLDTKVVKLLVSSTKFKEEFKLLKEEVMSKKSVKKVEQQLKKQTKKPDTYAQKFKKLMVANIDKDGNEMPISTWKAMQLVRYYCVAYLKYKKYDCTISFSGASIVSKELRHIAEIQDKFGGNAQKVIDYINWGFEVKDKELDRGGLSTNILATGNFMNEFNQAKSGSTGSSRISRNDLIDSDYKAWVEKNVPKLLEQYDFDNLNNLFWIKAAYDEGDVGFGEDKAVEEAIKRGILPKKGNLEFSNA